MTVRASAKITAAIAAILSNDLDLQEVIAELEADLTPIELDNGTGEYEYNKAWADERSLSASSNEDLDFAGSLTDALGNTITMTAIKAVFVRADKNNTNDVVVGGDATNTVLGIFSAEAGAMNVKPGGLMMWLAPKTGVSVVAGTGDLIRIANGSSGSSVTYKIVVLGIG